MQWNCLLDSLLFSLLTPCFTFTTFTTSKFDGNNFSGHKAHSSNKGPFGQLWFKIVSFFIFSLSFNLKQVELTLTCILVTCYELICNIRCEMNCIDESKLLLLTVRGRGVISPRVIVLIERNLQWSFGQVARWVEWKMWQKELGARGRVKWPRVSVWLI